MTRNMKVPACRAVATSLCLAGLLLAGNVHAALIPAFGLGDGPNFQAIELLVAYDSGSDTLFAVGDNVDLFQSEESAIQTVDGSGFRLQMRSPVNLARDPSGTIEITGFVPDLGFTSGTLLTGEIVDFGYVEFDDSVNGDNPYELQVVFVITGGDAAGLFGPTGAMGFTQTDFPGGWTQDWVNDSEGETITATFSPVPLPGALLLLGSGLIGLTRFARRRASV